MKIWKGLLKKEWLLMKDWFYKMIIATVLLTFVLPVLAELYLNNSINFLSEGFTLSSSLWLILNFLMPAIIIMISLRKESERLDIWLHSPVPIFKLFGAKIVFSIMTGAVNYLISLVLITTLFSVRISPIQLMFDSDVLGFMLLFLSVLFFASIMLMFIALFYHVLYLVLQPYTKKLTTVVTFGILVLSMWLEKIVTTSPIYQKISTFGKFWTISENRYYLMEEVTYLTVDDSLFYVGEVLLSLTFAGILFVVASVLFEKKVRL